MVKELARFGVLVFCDYHHPSHNPFIVTSVAELYLGNMPYANLRTIDLGLSLAEAQLRVNTGFSYRKIPAHSVAC